VFQYDEALATYRDAWQFEEHRVIVRTGAAAVLADLGRLDKAWTTIEPAVRHEDDPFALNCAGRIRRLMGDLAQAAEYHERALAQNKGRRQAKRELEKLVKQARGDGDEELATRVMKALALSA
jgi:tetratricopeptide (TPR) repeat protein